MQAQARELWAECFQPPCHPLPAMRDLFTFQNQACWEERLRKEAAARAAWKVKHGHKYPKERSLPRKRLQQAFLHSAPGVGPLPATSSPDRRTGLPETQGVRAQPPGRVGVQEAQRATREPSGQTERGSLEMRPVPSNTRQLLFQGLSHDGQGRALYLRERNRQKPAEKFRYPVLSSWEYGWHVGKGHHLSPFQAFAGSLAPSPASCSVPTPSPARPPGSLPLSRQAPPRVQAFAHLVCLPAMFLLPLSLLGNFHMSPPRGSLLRVLQAAF